MTRNKAHILIFLLATLAILLLGGFFLAAYPKTEIHLFINTHHSPAADIFFKYVTYFGEGWMFLLAIPAMLFFSWRNGLAIALAGLFTGIFTALFKNGFYKGAPRPVEFLRDVADLYIVPGVEINHWNSFPSGHTMAAFALYFTLAITIQKRGWSFIFFIIAVLVGYSRMYLSQHFLVDVVAGAGLGLVAASLAMFIVSKFPQKILDKRALDLF